MPINYNIDLKNDINNNINKNKKENSIMKNKLIQECCCKAFSNLDTYKYLYDLSINDPCKFWNTQILYIGKQNQLNHLIRQVINGVLMEFLIYVTTVLIGMLYLILPRQPLYGMEMILKIE